MIIVVKLDLTKKKWLKAFAKKDKLFKSMQSNFYRKRYLTRADYNRLVEEIDKKEKEGYKVIPPIMNDGLRFLAKKTDEYKTLLLFHQKNGFLSNSDYYKLLKDVNEDTSFDNTGKRKKKVRSSLFAEEPRKKISLGDHSRDHKPDID